MSDRSASPATFICLPRIAHCRDITRPYIGTRGRLDHGHPRVTCRTAHDPDSQSRASASRNGHPRRVHPGRRRRYGRARKHEHHSVAGVPGRCVRLVARDNAVSKRPRQGRHLFRLASNEGTTARLSAGGLQIFINTGNYVFRRARPRDFRQGDRDPKAAWQPGGRGRQNFMGTDLQPSRHCELGLRDLGG
jgi:hypothetical protein